MVPFLLWVQTLEETEREIFERIYYNYSYKVKGLALRIMRDSDDAEDVVSDVFEKIIKYKDNFIEADEKEINRLIVIYTRSICFNIMKRRKIIKFDSLERLTDNGMEFSELTDEMTNDDIIEKIIKKETSVFLARAIEKLGTPASEIITLTYYKNYTSSQIADILNMNSSTVRSSLQTSRAKLKRELEEYINGKAN